MALSTSSRNVSRSSRARCFALITRSSGSRTPVAAGRLGHLLWADLSFGIMPSYLVDKLYKGLIRVKTPDVAVGPRRARLVDQR